MGLDIDTLIVDDLSAGGVLIADETGEVDVSATTAAELLFVSGVTSAIQTQIDSKLTTSLTDANIFVGDVINIATGVAMSGEATIVNTGAVTLSNAAVIAKVLTGFVSGAGVVAATDTILEGIQKLNGNIGALVTGVSSVNAATGAITLTHTTAQGVSGVWTGTALALTLGALTGVTSFNGLVVTANTGAITTGTWTATKIGLAYGGTNADLSATGGTSQVLQQTSVGGAITVGQLSQSNLSNGISSLIITTGDQPTTNATATSITDLVFAVSASSRYSFQGFFHIGCSGTGGVKFAVTFPTGATMHFVYQGFSTTGTVYLQQNNTASGTLTTSAHCTVISSAGGVIVSGHVTIAETAGNIQFQFASGTAGQTSTIYQEGTFLRIQKVA